MNSTEAGMNTHVRARACFRARAVNVRVHVRVSRARVRVLVNRLRVPYARACDGILLRVAASDSKSSS
jgi:hypothetical protein